MQNIEQIVNGRQEIKSLHTSCESYFLTFPKKICGVSVIRSALQKIVQVDTRFYQDADGILVPPVTSSNASTPVIYPHSHNVMF